MMTGRGNSDSGSVRRNRLQALSVVAVALVVLAGGLVCSNLGFRLNLAPPAHAQTTCSDPVVGEYMAEDITACTTLLIDYLASTDPLATNASGEVIAGTPNHGNGANCAAGNYALGVDADGAAEGCTAAFAQSDVHACAVGLMLYAATSGQIDCESALKYLEDLNILKLRTWYPGSTDPSSTTFGGHCEDHPGYCWGWDAGGSDHCGGRYGCTDVAHCPDGSDSSCCIGPGNPSPCCAGSGTGRCTVECCTGSGTPWGCCSGSGAGTCTGEKCLTPTRFINQQTVDDDGFYFYTMVGGSIPPDGWDFMGGAVSTEDQFRIRAQMGGYADPLANVFRIDRNGDILFGDEDYPARIAYFYNQFNAEAGGVYLVPSGKYIAFAMDTTATNALVFTKSTSYTEALKIADFYHDGSDFSMRCFDGGGAPSLEADITCSGNEEITVDGNWKIETPHLPKGDLIHHCAGRATLGGNTRVYYRLGDVTMAATRGIPMPGPGSVLEARVFTVGNIIVGTKNCDIEVEVINSGSATNALTANSGNFSSSSHEWGGENTRDAANTTFVQDDMIAWALDCTASTGSGNIGAHFACVTLILDSVQ